VKQKGKPKKKSDKEIYSLIEEKMKDKNYYVLPHAKERQKERNISDLAVINILNNKPGYHRKRNKSKDKYENQFDWNYCIEGFDLGMGKKIRLIITFTEESHLLVITVMRLD
jgi:hypothetical protein